LQRQPVIDLARKELDWEPNVALEDGLAVTIEYFRQALQLSGVQSTEVSV
jgi:UDP-glucuronate decarboxylase